MRKLLAFVYVSALLTAGITTSAQSPLLPRDPSINGAQTFAIVVGVSKYKYVKPLAYADKDAILFKDYLKSPGGGDVKDENIFLLLNEQATNANFWGKGFQWLKAKKLQRGDRLFIYLAGHGDAIDEDQFFFLGFDCNPKGDKNNYLVAGAIQLFNLKKKIAAEASKGVEVIFVMDACRSNELPGGVSGQNFLNIAISEKKAGEIIMLATGAGQESLEDISIGSGQGLFTYYLVDGLNGMADSIGTPDNRVTFRELQGYVNKNVPSIAQQRFKKKQDPYFCCTENSERVIGRVDTAYLKRWLKTKKQIRRGPGNSFMGDRNYFTPAAVDTGLIETYNRFNRAIKNNQVASAENYFNQLNKKFPGNPYTMDAMSSLSVEYINIAQRKVDLYLDCNYAGTVRDRQENEDAAIRLEKAIAIVRGYDIDFANSLLNRLYLLKASANENLATSLEFAYRAQAIDRNGAYIHNRLALLHLGNNNTDSALFYADKAVKTAPNWLCAMNTLALVRQSMSTNNEKVPADTIKKPTKSVARKIHWGFGVGGGLSKLSVSPRTATQGDTLRVLGVKGKTRFDIGVLGQVNLSSRISIRPGVVLSFERSDVEFERRRQTGGFTKETIPVETISFMVPVPFIYRFSGKNVSPYISAGPAFNYIMQGNDENAERLPLLSFDITGEVGLGVDIGIPKAGIIISPEIRYSRGLLDTQDETSIRPYINVIEKFHRQGYTLNIYLRKR